MLNDAAIPDDCGVAIEYHWRVVNAKVSTADPQATIEQMQSASEGRAAVAPRNASKAPLLLGRQEFYQKDESTFSIGCDLRWLDVKYRHEAGQRQNSSPGQDAPFYNRQETIKYFTGNDLVRNNTQKFTEMEGS